MKKVNFKDVPLPIWMEKLPKDRRGYPIPYTVMRDKDGRPHFTVNEEHKRQHVIKKGLCPICGRKLLKRRALVGGPKSAFDPAGAYIDPPMHVECARYALQVCPWLAAPSYTKRIDAKTIDPKKVDNDVVLADPSMDPSRPELFVMVIHTKAINIKGHLFGTPFVQFIQPCWPYVDVEYWQHGERMPDEEGLKLTKDIQLAVYMSQVDSETLRKRGGG